MLLTDAIKSEMEVGIEVWAPLLAVMRPTHPTASRQAAQQGMLLVSRCLTGELLCSLRAALVSGGVHGDVG
jgi:hypothetical protein